MEESFGGVQISHSGRWNQNEILFEFLIIFYSFEKNAFDKQVKKLRKYIACWFR